MPKVFIVNKSNHDFSKAEKYGELIYCTEGSINRFATNDMIRKFTEVLDSSNSSPDDYILLCSLNVMNAIACSVFVNKHKTLNLLLYTKGDYVPRNHVFS